MLELNRFNRVLSILCLSAMAGMGAVATKPKTTQTKSQQTKAKAGPVGQSKLVSQPKAPAQAKAPVKKPAVKMASVKTPTKTVKRYYVAPISAQARTLGQDYVVQNV